MTLTYEEQATKAIARRSQEAGIGLHEVVTDAIREAVEDANTLNVSNIIGAAKDRIEAVDKAKADARKAAMDEVYSRCLQMADDDPTNGYAANVIMDWILCDQRRKEMEASDA